MNSETVIGFIDEIKKASEKDPVSLGESFIAGLDPTGSKTFKLSQKAKRHGKHKALGFAGGLIGGATLIPSAVSALTKGMSGLSTPGPLKKKIVTGLSRAARGSISPYKNLYHAATARRALKRAIKSGLLSEKDIGKIKKLISSDKIDKAKKIYSKAAGKDMERVLSQLTSKGVKLKGPMRRKALSVLDIIGERITQPAAAVGASAALGGGSSLLQYNLGKNVGDRVRALKKQN